MLAVLPLIAFLLLWRLFYRRELDLRCAFVSAAVVFGACLLALTEGLSTFRLLALPGVAAGWLIIGATAVLLARRAVPSRLRFPRFTAFQWGLMACIGAIAAVVALIGLIAPPNNWDSMTYHMARVAHWIHNQSVAPYPTPIQRQLYQPPWAEFAITHLQILSGNDRFANLVQWFALVGCLVVVSLIARELGAKTRGQWLAVVVCVTTPMVILQGSSTQNDLVLAFWITCVASVCVGAARHGLTGGRVILLGAAAGLAIATKGTSFVYLIPFALWMSGVAWYRLRTLWKYLIAGLLIMLLLNAGYVLRNRLVYGSMFGPDVDMYRNQVMSPAYFVSNVVRNLALHVTLEPGPNKTLQFSKTLTRVVKQIHVALGISMSEPATTFGYLRPVSFSSLHYDEDGTAAPAQLLLGGVSTILFASGYRRFRGSGSGYYLIAIAVGFGLFCLVFKFQPWHSRLHLPLFVLLSAFIGPVIAGRLPRLASNGISVALLVLALTPLLNNNTRPLAGPKAILNADRWSIYFRKNEGFQPIYARAVETARQQGCDRVGLHFTEDVWEYPLWARSAQTGAGLDFEGIDTPYLTSTFRPCVIFRALSPSDTATYEWDGQSFVRLWQDRDYDLLVPAR